ncbi:glutaredoxin 3 [Methylophilaceae bacterium]|jgi:glutaredoxin 3|nr:glutaredoxin 3 [Methylophilaceae bacterium]|tara:strand:+ start:192 stop:452 length:261 start_codon:yes stop_codon:yes gene_type:complete
MKHILMYTSSYCPYCENAERLLSEKGYDEIEKILVDENPKDLEKMIQITGKRTVPQIFIEKKHIGGFNELRAIDLSGELDRMLELN